MAEVFAPEATEQLKDMKICPTCHSLYLVPNWDYCSVDGARLQPSPKCGRCGYRVGMFKFCPLCGTKANVIQFPVTQSNPNNGGDKNVAN